MNSPRCTMAAIIMWPAARVQQGAAGPPDLPRRLASGKRRGADGIIAGMPVLVISDVHANIEALEAVVTDAGSFDELWFLGDAVG